MGNRIGGGIGALGAALALSTSMACAASPDGGEQVDANVGGVVAAVGDNVNFMGGAELSEDLLKDIADLKGAIGDLEKFDFSGMEKKGINSDYFSKTRASLLVKMKDTAVFASGGRRAVPGENFTMDAKIFRVASVMTEYNNFLDNLDKALQPRIGSE